MLFALILAGCTPQMVEDTDGSYAWSGFVYADIPVDGGAGLTFGAIEVRDTNNDLVTSGEQSDDQNPGNWRIPLSTAQALSLIHI